MKKIWHVICNPAANKGHAAETYRKIRGWADGRDDIQLILHMTAVASDATEITKKLTKTNKDVYIMIIGGDGTICEVLNGIQSFKHTYIMVMPFGSGNDFAYALKLPKKDPIELFQDYLLNAKNRKVDYFIINDKYRAINSVGFGISSRINEIRSKMKIYSNNPTKQYHIASNRAAMQWKGFTYWASFDNKPEVKLNTMWLEGTNGPRVGAKIYCNPDAKLDDGLISVIYIDSFPRIKTLSVLIKTLNGKVKKIKYAHFLTCKEFRLTLNNNDIEYDGNILEAQSALHVKVGPEKVNIIVPTYTLENNDK